MKCIYCGAEVNENGIFCSNCGKEIQIVPDYNSFEDDYLKALIQETSAKEEASQTEAGSNTNSAKKQKKTGNNTTQTPAKTPKKKSKAPIIIAVVVAVLCITGIAASVMIRSKIQTQQENSFDYQYSMGQDAANQNKTGLAISYFEKALSLDSSNLEAKKSLYPLYMTQKKYDDAFTLCKEIIKAEPSNVDAYRTLITIYQNKSDIDSIVELSKGVTDTNVLQLFADYIVTPPVFNLSAGTYQKYLELELSTTGKYNILYNMDGDDPIKSGKRYLGTISLDEMKTYEISAVCVNDKGIYSDVVTKRYVIDIPAPDMPEVSPDGGTFTAATYVQINVPSGCSAYYTWDGTNPSAESEEYMEPLEVPEGNNVLSVIIIDNSTDLVSDIYRGNFVYYSSND